MIIKRSPTSPRHQRQLWWRSSIPALKCLGSIRYELLLVTISSDRHRIRHSHFLGQRFLYQKSNSLLGIWATRQSGNLVLVPYAKHGWIIDGFSRYCIAASPHPEPLFRSEVLQPVCIIKNTTAARQAEAYSRVSMKAFFVWQTRFQVVMSFHPAGVETTPLVPAFRYSRLAIIPARKESICSACS